MIAAALGFDLAGRQEPALRRGILLGIGAACCEALPYAELARVLLSVTGGAPSPWLVLEAFLVVAATTLMLGVLRARGVVVNFTATYGLVADARLRVADHLSHLPMGRMHGQHSAVLAELLTGRFAQYQDVVTHAWGMAVVNAALPGFLWLLMLWLAWPLALLTAAFVPLAMLAIPWCHRRMDAAAARLAPRQNAMAARVAEAIAGVRDLQQFPAGAEARQAELLETLRLLEAEQMRHELAPAPALLAYGFLGQLGFACAAVIGVLWLPPGGAPALLAFLPIGLRFWRAMADLGLQLAELRFARQTLARIRAITAEPVLSQPGSAQPPGPGGLVFQDVHFAPVLHGISGAVPAGRLVALVGESGSGKTQLAHLAGRLWDPDTGSIRLGGTDLRQIDAARLNSAIAMVLQDVALFDASVADNIRLGRPDAGDEAVQAAARAARAHDFIMALPEGYATRLRAAGEELSGGERQRLAIARALLKDAPVLVLDEATAQIDPGNEAEIQDAVAALACGRTVLVIAHRLRTVTDADEIWVMQEGRVVERGRHEALLARGGAYRALWDAQEEVRAWRLDGGEPAPRRDP